MNKPLWWVAFGILGGLLGAGVLFLITRPPRGEPVALLPPPTPLPKIIYVTGAVIQEGIYSLPVGSRVNDAIQAAGGFAIDANTNGINLAALLVDGEQIVVPKLPPTPELSTDDLSIDESNTDELSTDISPSRTSSLLVNINTATLEELDELPGIGPVIGQAIIDYRNANGPFARIEDIQDVSGIGPVTYEKIKDLITVGSSP